jgi:hypothetical protein
MGEGALKAPVCAELGMDITSSSAVLAGRKLKFFIWVTSVVTPGSFAVRDRHVPV